MLNKRSVEILMYLIDVDNTISLEELALKYQLSKRSIRYDIDNINFFLKVNNFNELKKYSKGIYKLEETVEHHHEIIQLIKNKYYIFSPAERIDFIKANLYFSKSPLKMNYIEEKLSVSNSTARSDMNEIKNYFEERGLRINYHPKKGFLLSGDEETLRKLALKFLFKYVKITNSEISYRDNLIPTLGIDLILLTVLDYFKDISITKISNFIRVIASDLKTSISDEANTLLKLYLIILISRIEEFHFINKRQENEMFLSGSEEYEILKKRIGDIEESFGITLNNSELLFFTELLLGSHSYNFNTSLFKHWIELEHLVKKIIHEVSEELDMDLSKDLLLQNGIVNHLKPSLYRIKHDITLKNNMVDEIRILYPKYFNAVKISCSNNLKPHVGKVIPDEEIGYLTIHFKMAIDRIFSSAKPKNVLLVCSFGYGTTRLLAQQLNEEFNINIINILPYHEFSEMKECDDVDFIITTLDLTQQQKNIPIIKVTPLLTEENKKKFLDMGIQRKSEAVPLSKIMDIIYEYENSQDKGRLIDNLKKILPVNLIDDLKVESKGSLSSFLTENNIQLIKSASSWREAIISAGKLLEKQGCSSKGYTDAMIDNINKNGSYMVINDHIAIPHASADKYVNKTGFSLLFLEDAVEFPEEKMVKLIVAFASLDQSEHSKALTDLIDLIEDHSLFEFLSNSPTKNEIIEFIDSKRFD